MNARTGTAALLVVVLGAAGCGAGDDPGADAAATGRPLSDTFPTAGPVLFEDGFDDDRNKWGVIDDPQYGTTAYDGGDYVWDFRGRLAHISPEVLFDQYDEGALDLRDVLVRSTVTVVKGGGVVGVSCRETPDDDAEYQWYEFVARDGFAAIRQADDKGNIEVLAETQDVALPVGEPVAIEAACIDDAAGNGQLSLALDHEPVLQATASDPLGNGVPGLQAWTFPAHEQMDILWHDFSIRSPAK